MTDRPPIENKVQVSSECLARAYAETVATKPSETNVLSLSNTVQADKWNNLQQKVGICQNLAGKLPDLEITVTTERGQPPLVVVNHIEKK